MLTGASTLETPLLEGGFKREEIRDDDPLKDYYSNSDDEVRNNNKKKSRGDDSDDSSKKFVGRRGVRAPNHKSKIPRYEKGF